MSSTLHRPHQKAISTSTLWSEAAMGLRALPPPSNMIYNPPLGDGAR